MRRLPIALAALVLAIGAHAQTWEQVFTIPQSTMSCAFFFNAQQGMIGTGNYFGGALATIYFTTDGGTTWRRASMPSNGIVGQVNEIYFRDATNGWATITEATPTGWSGIYHSTDRGRSWRLVRQAGFPVGIRETSRGVYYTDRDINPGVNFSSDQGKTWRAILSLNSCLDIDFYDDDNAFVSSQAYGSPPAHAATTDGGVSWKLVETDAECWSLAANPRAKSFILSSEQTNGGTGSSTSILTGRSIGPSETKTYFGPAFGLTGGVRVYNGCATIAYAQVRRASGSLVPGFLRSSDDGATWSSIDGPCNRADTRFGVTGRGAVLFAGDSAGGVWRSMDAAGQNVQASVLPSVQAVSSASSARSYICDSVAVAIRLSYGGCDSIRLDDVWIENDTAKETSIENNPTASLNATHRDSMVVIYRPKSVRTWTARIHLRITQPDGYAEDTVISLLMLGLRPRAGTLKFTGTLDPTRLNFDSVALCSTTSKPISLQSTSCYDLHVSGIKVSAPFRLRSSFSPFTLTSDAERSFLIEYTATSTLTESGTLIITHDQGADTLLLTGCGISPRSKLSFPSVSIEAPVCDSAAITVQLHNITCSALTGVALSGARHVVVDESADSIGVDRSLPFIIHFVPSAPGSGNDTLHVQFTQFGTTYDTTIIVNWKATPGTPGLALSNARLDYGLLSPCSTGANDTLVIYNTGCGELDVNVVLEDPNQGFTLSREPAHIAGNSTDTIIIRYVPKAPGTNAATNVRLTSNAGDTIIALSGAASAGDGEFDLSIDSIASVLTCETSSFEIRLRNATCDSLFLLSEELQDPANADFAIANTAGPLGRDGSISIRVIFQPEAAGTRSNEIVLHFSKNDGTPFDTAIAVTGVASEPPAVSVYLDQRRVTANAGKTIALPVIVEGTTAFPVRSLELTFSLTTDLLTPVGIVTGAGELGDAVVTAIRISPDSATLYLSLPNERVISSGELLELRCRTYVAKTLTTTVAIQRATLDNAQPQVRCLPTALLDTTAQFTLDPLCGDITISHTLEAGTVVIESITPNPTRSNVVLRLRSSLPFAVDAVVDVLNVAGETVQAIGVRIDPGISAVPLALNGSEGVRYLRIRTPSGTIRPIESQPVILQK